MQETGSLAAEVAISKIRRNRGVWIMLFCFVGGKAFRGAFENSIDLPECYQMCLDLFHIYRGISSF